MENCYIIIYKDTAFAHYSYAILYGACYEDAIGDFYSDCAFEGIDKDMFMKIAYKLEM